MYNKKIIDKLNKSIKDLFPHLKTIEESYKVTHKSIARMVMLDRYSQKDEQLKTLEIGDVVLVTITQHAKFPTRGIGNVKKISGNNITVILEEEYIGSNNNNSEITRTKNDIVKPLEIYYEQIAYRVGHALSKVEKKKDQNKWGNEFASELSNMNVVPAGRVLYGAGSGTNVTFFNCFVLPFIEDSRHGISTHRQEVMEIMSRGGGVGTNGSSLRPKHAIAKGVGGRSSGSVSWLNDISKLTHLVEQGGSRRGAQMIMLSDWHPDIIEFIISKMQNIKILKWLKDNSKDEVILKEVENKIEFVPIEYLNSKIYKKIIDNQKLFDIETIDVAKRSIKHGGEWTIIDKEFLSGANISVTITNDFMKAVEKDHNWDLKYPDLDSLTPKQKDFYDKKWHKMGDVREWEKLGYPTKIYHTIKAKELWHLISFCANYSAEPGIFFIDTANKYTNATVYGQKVIATNPCGEQPLAPYSVCNLAALNLANFVDKDKKEVMWDKLEKSINTTIRLQDNVIDVTPYFIESNKKQALGERRIGMGVMGLHDMLIWLGIKYGSPESIKFLDKLFSFITNKSYLASTRLSKEKGPFTFLPKNNYKKMSETNFVKKLDKNVREEIATNGLRNSHLLTIAPTGSTGTMAGVSTGLEPYFALEFYRSGRLGQNIKMSADIVQEWLEKHSNGKYSNKDLPDFFITAMNLTTKEHVDVQNIIQKWVDSSISKTVNAPKGYTVKQVEEIYMQLFKGGAKGGTVYVDGSREAQVLSLGEEEKISTDEFGLEDITATHEFEVVDATLRSDRQDRKIGTNAGEICPLCKEGTLVDAGGCTTCPNCGGQLKCGL